MNLSFKTIGRFVLTRVFLIYILGMVAVYQVMDVRGALDRAKAQTLNRLIPQDVGKILLLSREPDAVSSQDLRSIIYYFKKAQQYRSDANGADGIIAYCYYYLGDISKAIEHYKKDLNENPQYFWSHFNLALIYFQQGDVQEAVDHLQICLLLQPDVSLNMMSSWKTYQQVLGNQRDNVPLIGGSMTEAYDDAYQILLAGYERSNDFERMEATAQKALELHFDGKDVFYYYTGLGAFKRKDFARAGYFLQKAVEENMAMAPAYYYLGQCALIAGNANLSKELTIRSEQLGGRDQLPFDRQRLAVRLL